MEYFASEIHINHNYNCTNDKIHNGCMNLKILEKDFNRFPKNLKKINKKLRNT